MAKSIEESTGSAQSNVIVGVHRRRRWTFMEKLRAAQEASTPGMSVSSVARKYGMAPSQLFRWRKVILDFAVEPLGDDGQALGTTEIRELKRQVRELERLLGKKTLENETLREAIVMEKSKNGRLPMLAEKRFLPEM